MIKNIALTMLKLLIIKQVEYDKQEHTDVREKPRREKTTGRGENFEKKCYYWIMLECSNKRERVIKHRAKDNHMDLCISNFDKNPFGSPNFDCYMAMMVLLTDCHSPLRVSKGIV